MGGGCSCLNRMEKRDYTVIKPFKETISLYNLEKVKERTVFFLRHTKEVRIRWLSSTSTSTFNTPVRILKDLISFLLPYTNGIHRF